MRTTAYFFTTVASKVSEITDGLSHTLFAGETIQGDLAIGSNLWTNGNRLNSTMRVACNPINWPPGDKNGPCGYLLDAATGTNIANGAFQSRHPGGANFGYGDGHITFLQDSIDLIVYKALATRAGGEESRPTVPTNNSGWEFRIHATCNGSRSAIIRPGDNVGTRSRLQRRQAKTRSRIRKCADRWPAAYVGLSRICPQGAHAPPGAPSIKTVTSR